MRALPVFVVFCLLGADLVLLAGSETTSEFTLDDEKLDSVVYDFYEADRNGSVTLEFPASTVTSASLTIRGEELEGSYPSDVELKIRSEKWRYSGQGYGALGQQQTFASGGLGKPTVFHDNGDVDIEILLPANATIREAGLNITGYAYGTGDLNPYQLSSTDTNGGSISQTPAVARNSDGDIFVVWLDDGDLETRSTSWDSIIFRSYTDGSWNDAKLISRTTAYLMPRIFEDGGILYLSWINNMYPNKLSLTTSANDGESWSNFRSIRANGGNYIYDYDLVKEGDNLHLLWSDSGNMSGSGFDYDIYHRYSSDGGASWSEPVQVNSPSSSSTSYQCRFAASGENLHAVWIEYNFTSGEGTRYITYYSHSTNNGQLWSIPYQMHEAGTENSGYRPTVAVASVGASNYVHVGWYEYFRESLGTYEVQMRSSSDGGVIYGQVKEISDENDDGTYAFPYNPLEIRANSEGEVHLTWARTQYDGDPAIIIVRSTNSGNSFGEPVEVDSGAPSIARDWPGMDIEGDNLVMVWSDREPASGTGGDMDISVSQSTDSGQSWSQPVYLSEQYYESIESSMPSLATTEDYLHLIYWDGGEISSNGNNAHNDDGDIFYRRSMDHGVTWSDPAVLSEEGDRLIYNPHGSYLYQVEIVATGNHLYAIWLSRDPENNGFHISLTHSGNQGTSWTEPVALRRNALSVYEPAIAAEGGRVHVAYREGTDIMVLTSRDYGVNWDYGRMVTDGDSNYRPSIGIGGGRVHLAWDSYYNDGERYDYEIHYSKSTDQGRNWDPSVRITNSTAYQSLYACLAVDASGVFIAWRDYGDFDRDDTGDYDLIMVASLNRGDTWEPAVLISDDDDPYMSNSQTYARLKVGNGLLYALWMERPASGAVGDTWIFDLEEQNWTEREPNNHPEPTYYHAMATGVSLGTHTTSVVFGGYTITGYTNKTWVYYHNSDYWMESSSEEVPSARYFHDMATDWNSDRIVMFGGYGMNESGFYAYRNDTWLYYAERDLWLEVSDAGGPPPRYQHAMAFDNITGDVILYGGYGMNESGYYQRFNDTWAFDMQTLTWSQVDTPVNPGKRSYHEMAGDHSGNIMMFGGYIDGVGYDENTWRYRDGNWTMVESTTHPESLRYHAMKHDRENDMIVVFGGYKATAPYYSDETWVLDGSTGSWALIETNATPLARYYHDMAYDSGTMVMFGGYVATEFDLYLRFSMDQGQNWSEFVHVSDIEGGKLTTSNEAPALAIGERTYLAFRDNGDVDGAGSDDSDIFVRATKGSDYPANPKIDIGSNGQYEWQWGDEFNSNNSPVRWDSDSSPGAAGESFRASLVDALANADTFVDEYGVEMARIPITVSSDSKGVIWLSSLSVEYDVVFTFSGGGLVQQLNKRVTAALQAGLEVATTTLYVTSQSQGRVVVGNLAIETEECDVELRSLQLNPSNPRQGDDLEITAKLRNTGPANARVQVAFWYDVKDLAHRIANFSTMVYVGGGDAEAHATWQDIPSGEHTIMVGVIETFPGDSTSSSSVWYKEMTVNFPETNPDIYVTNDGFRLAATPVEQVSNLLTVELDNRGERSGTVDIVVREQDSDGAVILRELGVEVDVNSPEKRTADWLVRDIKRLHLLVLDNETGVPGETLDERFLDIDVQILARFTMLDASWTPDQISDGSLVDFSMTLQNSGSFDVLASVEVKLVKGTRTITADPTYWAGQQFLANGQRQFEFQVRFSEAQGGMGQLLYGDWILQARVFNINPVNEEDQGIWDPEALEFIDESTTVVVAEPPELLLDESSLTITPAKPTAGEVATISMAVYNDGGTDATGQVRVVYGGHSDIIGTFDIVANGEAYPELVWNVPASMSGDVTIEVQLANIQPAEAGGPAALLDNGGSLRFDVTASSAVVAPGSSSDAGSPLLILALVGLVLFGGIGVTWFVYQRSQDVIPLPAASPAAAMAAVTLQCPKCSTMLKVTSPQRPLIVNCTGCATRLQLDE